MSRPITVTVQIDGLLQAIEQAAQPAAASAPEVPVPVVGEVVPVAPDGAQEDGVPHVGRTLDVSNPEATPRVCTGLTDLQRLTAEALAAVEARERGQSESDCVCDHHVIARWMRDPRWDAAKVVVEGRQPFPMAYTGG